VAEGRIVGIGASAGGLESLERLFTAIPPDTGMAFVVVQHLSPDFRSVMDELIARHSDMPVQLAEDGVAVEPNRIYLMPPRKEMMIRDRRLWLADKEPNTFSLPIDSFFRSLAQDVGSQSVAIVLSGSGSDGSRGIIDVKRAGGLVFAETPATAKFDSMPMAAAAAGVVDRVFSPGDIGRYLCGLTPTETALEPMILSEDPAMDAVLRLIRDHFGIDFSVYKMTTVGRRIQRRVEMLMLGNLAEYVEHLHSDPDELHRVYQDLLIGVTQFFRDPDAFEALERDVIPSLVDQLKPDQELRIWVAGCATGEEAYSLAMLFWEAFKLRGRAPRIKILATDVHQRSLDYAGAGIYGEEQLGHVSPDRLERFFTKRTSGYQVSQELRQLIVFARHNVLKDAPFTKMHFISCRNMLIYFQPPAQRTVLSLFHFGLISNGMLFLGASETPGALSDEFNTVSERWKMFRKRRDVHLLGQVRLPLQPSGSRKPIVELPRTPLTDPLLLALYDQMLDKFMPPALLLDENRMLIDAFGGAEKLLQLRPRRPSLSALDLMTDELRTVVAGAIQRAVKEGQAVSFSGVPLPSELGEKRGSIIVEPLTHQRTGARNILVTFRDLKDTPRVEGTQSPSMTMSEASLERMSTLETELQYTRETLQATIEELETSNEEMQATNEELVASNEELQSTNEELHSVNEELYTVNAEYQQKIAELKELNADMTHLLEGTDVGTVFLDRDLRIRRFTSRIASVFRFQQHDIGRRISDFSHNIERPQLMDEIDQARTRGLLVEAEVRDTAGTPYFLRILPYRVSPRTAAQVGYDPTAIDGVVLTLTDMTALDKARTKVEQLSALVEWSNDAIFSLTLDGTITTWNRGAERLYGHTSEDAIGRSATLLLRPGGEPELAGFVGQLERGERIDHADTLCRHQDGSLRDISASIAPIYNRNRLAGIAVCARDISKITLAQRALEVEQRKVRTLLAESEQQAHRRDEFLAMLSHELRNPLAAVLTATNAMVEHDEKLELRKKCQAVIERQATHMKRLLDDLLDVSRITSNKFEIAGDDLDLREALATAIEATAHAYQANAMKLEAEIPERPLPVRGDVRRLAQVFVNLLSNAATYSPSGTLVKLIVTTPDERIRIAVRDQGEGIAPDLQPRIFDLFVQSEQKLDRPRGGLGVGLSLVKMIVQLHGGEIEVRSRGKGTGTEFVIHLPLGRLTTMRLSHAGVPGGACKIVLVDDQDDAREMLRVLFEARNHVVFETADGAGAVQLISHERPDIAFIDIGLPVMNGFEVAQRIRRLPELQGVMLVALSGYGNKTDVDAALAAGFDDHITKPAEFKKLEEILARRRPHTDDD
jgi:two-component system CheB/CheR fusion protein